MILINAKLKVKNSKKDLRYGLLVILINAKLEEVINSMFAGNLVAKGEI